MFEVEVKRNGVLVATIQWSPGPGAHNTKIIGDWGHSSLHCDNLQVALAEAQKRIAGI